jgi:hypothetical protein
MQPVSKQQLDKYVSAARNTKATIEAWCFLYGQFPDIISRTDATKQLLVRVVSSSVESQPVKED